MPPPVMNLEAMVLRETSWSQKDSSQDPSPRRVIQPTGRTDVPRGRGMGLVLNGDSFCSGDGQVLGILDGGDTYMVS